MKKSRDKLNKSLAKNPNRGPAKSININSTLTEVYMLVLFVLLLFCPGWNGLSTGSGNPSSVGDSGRIFGDLGIFGAYGGYENLTATKFWVYAVLTCIYALVMLCLFITQCVGRGSDIGNSSDFSKSIGRYVPMQEGCVGVNATKCFLLALTWIFVALSWISAFSSDFGFMACLGLEKNNGLAAITLYGISFTFVLFFGKLTRSLCIAAIASLAIYEAICILQLLGFNPLWLYPAGLDYYGHDNAYSGAFLGTLGNLNLTGAFFTLCLPALLWVVLLSTSDGILARRGYYRDADLKRCCIPERMLMLGIILMLVVGVAILVITGSGAALVGLVVGCIVAVPIMCNWDKRRVTAWILILIIILALCAGAWVFVNGAPDDSAGSGRVYIWKNVLEVCHENILLGNGPSTLDLVFNQLNQAHLQPAQNSTNANRYDDAFIGFKRYDSNTNTLHVGTISDSHCLPLNILANEGLLALLVFLSVAAILLRHWANNRDVLRTAFLGTVLLCFAIQSLFCISSFIILPFALMTVALCVNNPPNKSG